MCVTGPVTAVDLEQARELFLTGQYPRCAAVAELGATEYPIVEEWRLLWIESLLAMGHYPRALEVTSNALERLSNSIRLRWIGREVYRRNGDPAHGRQMVLEILRLAATRPWAYRNAADLVAFGQAALVEGAEPKRVLDQVFQEAKKRDPEERTAYLAAGELALEKHDYALAARTFQEGLKHLPDDPDLHFGLARAYAPSDTALMMSALEEALKRNSNHVGSLLWLVDHQVDAEDYARADELLDRILRINPWHPQAWAYRAVLAHLQHEPAREQAAREMVLKYWPTDPAVPHLIGRKLSQKYRFSEGAALQRQALKFDPDYLPAQAQLAQDLLRLGQEEEGWRLAEEVHNRDPYDVAALNLVTLHDTLRKFRVLTNEHFILRMTPAEADLYGASALALLEAARQELCPRYGLDSLDPVTVEIFAEQKDFAVRTFGMPENHGFLGVCFGPVITANSPASRPGDAFNWQAMLWHEFCHVVTLHLTRNKMPRWLSEGISVYEERRANPAWGERMNPRYRQMILGEELTSISKLSAAFLAPPSEEHLQFAYFESSLVVEFIVQRYGIEALRGILRNLGEDQAIIKAIEQHTTGMAELEKQFKAFARARAEQWGSGLDWERPGLELMLALPSTAEWQRWAEDHPTNFFVLHHQAEMEIEREDWEAARRTLELLYRHCPEMTGPDAPARKLAQVYRALGRIEDERRCLAGLAERDGEAPEVYARLMELEAARGDWPAVLRYARKYLEVNPLVPLPHRYLAQAAEKIAQPQAVVEACRALLKLDPANPAELHYRLARALHETGDRQARREVLLALEDAPRYREALQLLWQIHEAEASEATGQDQVPGSPDKPALKPAARSGALRNRQASDPSVTQSMP